MECKPEIKNRVKRASGQIEGVITMMDEGRSCQDIVIQLKAIRSSIDRIIAHVSTENLLQSIEETQPIDRSDFQAAIDLLKKSI